MTAISKKRTLALHAMSPMDFSYNVKNVRTGPRGGKWNHYRVNKRFMEELFLEFSDKEFTTQDAYNLYINDRAQVPTLTRTPPFPDGDMYWVKVNIRNNLYAANAQGILRLMRPGVFQIDVGGIDNHV